jgi:methionyl-tRNA formyltransferase
MRILFIGTVEFSLLVLETLIDMEENVVGVVTKSSSSFNSDFADLTPCCEKHEIPYKFSTNINDAYTVSWIRNLEPDIIFCVGWSNLLKKEILNIPPMGVVGFHPAKLPQNRGRHPLIWALVLGLRETASTFFFMNEGVDSGDIISQRKITISNMTNARLLYDKVKRCMVKQIKHFVPKLKNDTLILRKQDFSNSNVWRKRGEEDGRIDFRMTSRAVHNLVRALSEPYVNAHFMYEGNKVKVLYVVTHILTEDNLEPGKVLRVGEDIIAVKCGEDAIVLRVEEGSKLPEVGEYL